MNEKIEKLRDLFAQRETIDAEISGILEGGALPDKKPLPILPAKKKEPKTKVGNPVKEKRKYEKRDQKYKSYRCKDCEDEFTSKENLLGAVCPSCKSIHVEKAL